MSIRKKIFLNTTIRWIGEFISKIGWFIFMLLFARKLGTVDFGYFSYAFSLGSLLVVFSDLGTNILIVKEVSQDKNKINYFLGNILSLKIIFSIIIFFVILSIGFFNKDNFLAVILFCLSLIISAFLDPFNSLYRADKKLYLETVVILLWRLLIVFVSILGLFLFNFKLLQLSYVFLIISMLSVIITYLISKRNYNINFNLVNISKWKEILRQAFPLGTIIIFGAIFFKLNTLILQHFSGANDVGIYSAAFKLVEGSFFISTIFISSVFPFFCELCEKNDLRVIKLFKKSFIILFFISIAIIFPVYIYSEDIINFLYGKKFFDSVQSLKIIIFSLTFIFLNELYSYFFISIKKQYLVNKILFFSVINYIVLNIFLVTIFDRGFLGTSWALVVSQIFIFVLYSINFFGLLSKKQI